MLFEYIGINIILYITYHDIHNIMITLARIRNDSWYAI